MENALEQKLNRCYAALRTYTDFKPKVGLVLGSGLGDFAEQLTPKTVINYADIDGFPVSTVSGHKGCFVLAEPEGLPVVIMQGRVHYYEGYPMSDVVLPVRLMAKMGIDTLILTNAAGGINTAFCPGDFMMITDHIAGLVPNPLIGPNCDSFGTRFPDMSHIYDEHLQTLLQACADECGIPLRKGVYLQQTGPSYESPAEVRMAKIVGADAVGMSTACEAIAAKHMGLRIAGISCITNLACGLSDKPLSHEEVKQTADRASADFKKLLNGFLHTLADEQSV